jgi:aspartate/methionine/tyrosine aminotransferase
VPLPLLEERDFVFDLDQLASLLGPRTKLVILNSPHNPTGGVIGPDETAAAAELLAGSTAWVLSDEVYSQMAYDGDFASVASQPGLLERTILLDGLSKTYAMTGWRCGFAAVPAPLVDPLVRFFVNSTSCVPPFVQRAGIAALTGPQDEPRAMVDEFRQRRDLVVEDLNGLPGVSCRMPRGAFYAFPNVGGLPVPADELAERLLAEAGVALLAGTAFGRVGRDNLRLSYANSRENLAEGLRRMAALIENL